MGWKISSPYGERGKTMSKFDIRVEMILANLRDSQGASSTLKGLTRYHIETLLSLADSAINNEFIAVVEAIHKARFNNENVQAMTEDDWKYCSKLATAAISAPSTYQQSKKKQKDVDTSTTLYTITKKGQVTCSNYFRSDEDAIEWAQEKGPLGDENVTYLWRLVLKG